jgi:hypothetical protein
MRVKAIHLDENLVQGLFTLIVPSPKACTTLAPDRIEFIDEDDTRGAFLGGLKEVTNPAGTDADEHLDELGSGHREKGDVCFAGDGFGEQGFAGTRWTNQQNASGDLAAESLEAAGIFEKLHDLDQFRFGLVDARNISKCRLGFAAHVEPRSTLPKREEATLGGSHPATQPPEQQDHQEQGSNKDQDI